MILALLRAIPRGVYMAGAGLAALGVALAVAASHGASQQRAKDAPIIAQVPVAQGAARLNQTTTEDASARHVKDNQRVARGEAHAARSAAPGDDGYRAMLEWLCDTDGEQPGCAP